MRLIDADALIQAADKMFEHIDSPLLNHLTTYDVYSLINNAPTVDTTFREVVAYECGQKSEERPQGEWIKHIDDLYPEDSTEECPFCHEEQRLVGNDDNFCPNCGADMRKE